MSQRHSEYARISGDCYFTPDWVYGALYGVESFKDPWDVAPRERGDFDFLQVTATGRDIVTNPPFSLSNEFARHALSLTEPNLGKVAMLLPLAWDSAKGRRDLFADCPAFKAKYTLTRRIRWENLEQKANGPSANHAWFVWDWRRGGAPILGWLP